MTAGLPDTTTLHRLLEQAPGFIAFMDRDLNVLYLNRAEHGYERDKLIVANLNLFYTPEEGKKVFAAYHRSLETGEEQLVESFVDTPSGGRRWFSTRVSAMRDERGQVLGCVVISGEVTEQK